MGGNETGQKYREAVEGASERFGRASSTWRRNRARNSIHGAPLGPLFYFCRGGAEVL